MASELPKALLVDMDDTILSYEAVGERCWREACLRFAPQVTGLDPEGLLGAIMASLAEYWHDPERNRRGRLDLGAARREIVSAAFTRLKVDAPVVQNGIADLFTEIREYAVEAIPGAIEALHVLRRAGVRLALITNGASQPQRAKIQRFNLAPLFESILVEEEFGAGKPEPQVYLHSLKQIDAKPSEAWMVGDNLEFDVEAPQKLGIKGIWVDWQAGGLPVASSVKPDRIVNRLSELVDGI
ncbi:MAG: HAD family hydrolase [Chloroflexi bacterium]|nr:HAD family hydrolase [Chloroflexota bacterium]